MEPLKKYYSSISTLRNTLLEKEKRLAALEEVEKKINREFNGEKPLGKRPETSFFNNFANVENLFCTLLSNLETYNETSQFFLNSLCLACKHLLKKLKAESQIKISDLCLNLAEKAFPEKNWLLLEKCFKVFKLFENREWNNVLLNDQHKNRILKIIHSSVSIGRESLGSKTKQEFAALQILCVEILNNIFKTEHFKRNDIKPQECFMLLFPLLFDENCELRKVAYQTFVFLKNQCPEVCNQLLVQCPSLREQLKTLYSKKLAHFARTNELDWVDLWCFMVGLLGQDCTARKNTDLINNLLQAEEIGFRSSNMNTRYNAFVGWKFLVNRFLDTSLEDSSRRLKLLMQPLITSNSKTTDILCIKFDIWWQLIMGIEPCIQRHVTNILYHFLNFCFGPVSDGSAVNIVCPNSDIPNTLASRRPVISNVTNYPIVTTRRWKGLEVNRTDALAQILNLNGNPIKEFKLQHFKTPVISTPQTFLSLSKMLIHCVGECTILCIDCKDMSSQEKKFYLREIWKNLLLHVRKVSEMPSNTGQDASERQDKTEMMKNMFRILLRLNEMALNNQHLANICLNPVLEIILSTENGLPDVVLTSRNYYVGTDVMMGTPLSILLDMFLSPAFLSIRAHSDEHRSATDVLYMVLLQRIVLLGVGSSENAILFTQTVLKRIEAVVSNISVEGNKVKSIWIMLARVLTSSYVGIGREINQGTDEKADFSWLITVLMFPVIYSKIFLTDQDMILRIWSQLNQALLRNIQSCICSVKGNEMCCILCNKVQQEITKKKNIQSNELLHIMCLVTCAIEQIPFLTLNKIISGNASESEKLGHVQQCFQILQTLSVEIQKLKVEDNMYLPIVTQYVKCYQVFCDNLKGCPVQFLTLFFIEQIQFILSFKIESNNKPSSTLFSSTCIRTWKSFLHVLLSGCLRTIKQKQTVVKMIQPVLLSSFNHADHAIHEITINFSLTEKINLQTNYECNKCRIMQERMSLGRTALFSTISSSEVNSDGKFKDLLSRPLTKHQKEAFKQRRDDIPALYQDLTQDSQPSFSDSQDLSQMAANPTMTATSTDECVSLPRNASFQTKENCSLVSKKSPSSCGVFKASLKQLLADSTGDGNKKTNRIEIVKCSKKAAASKSEDQPVEISGASVAKSPEIHMSHQNQNEKRAAGKTPNCQKTSPAVKHASKTDPDTPSKASLETNVKENPDLEGKKLNSESVGTLSNTLKIKFNKGFGETPRIIKVCKSEIKGVNPEVKRIIIKLPVTSEKNSSKEKIPAVAENCSDVVNTNNFISKCDKRKSDSLNVEHNPCCGLEDDIKSKVIEDISDTLELTKNESVSVKRHASEEENTTVISDHCAVNSTDFKKMSQQSTVDETIKKASRCNAQSPVKLIENDPNGSSANGNKVVSPARVVLKRLEMNDVNNYSCRALLFKDQENKKSEIISNETIDNHKIEFGNNELNSSTIEDLELGANKDLLSESLISSNVEEVKVLERESKDQQSLLPFFPKEDKSKSTVSQMQDTESAPNDHLIKSKIPKASYQTRAKATKSFHFTRSYEKRKGEQNQRNNSPKVNVMVAKASSVQKTIEIVEMVNQRQSKTLKTAQNCQNNISSPQKTDIQYPTSPVANSKHNNKDKIKENILEGNCTPSINHAMTENAHMNSKPHLVNHVQNSEKALPSDGIEDECNQVAPVEISVCDREVQQQDCEVKSEEIHSTSVPVISQNKVKATSSAEVCDTEEYEKQESTGIIEGCLQKTNKSEKDASKENEQMINGSEDHESTVKMQDGISDCPKGNTYFPVIPESELTVPSQENLRNESPTKSSSCSINSESVSEDCQIMAEPSQIPVCQSVDVILQNSPDEPRNDLNKGTNNVASEISGNRDVSSQIPCDKGEYIRSLSLMPQNANSATQPKAHKISTRSDWARRFGCRSEGDLPKNTDHFSQKNGDENMDSSSDVTGSVDSLDYLDIVESSQDKKVLFKECFISLPKLSITPGCVLSGIEGCLLVSKEISSGLFKVIDKTYGGNDANIESSLEDTEKIKLKTSFCGTEIEIPESTAQQSLDSMQEETATDTLPTENDQCYLAVGEIGSTCKSQKSVQVLEDGEDISKCASELCNMNSKEKELIDLTFDNDIDAEKENADIKSDGPENIFSENKNAISIPEAHGKDERRKRKRNDEISKKYAKKRRIIQPSTINECNEWTEEALGSAENESLGVTSTEITESESTSQNNEVAEKPSPPKFSVGAALLNGSPIKIKRTKHLMKSEDSSPSRKHMSGRAAQLVDLALTKKSITNIENSDPTPSTSSDMGLEESNHDVIFTLNSEGEEEKSPWVRSTPQSEASPGKTNLKRKLPADECANETPPSRKSVRFSDPEVTRKLHFQKIENPEKTTFRIVRTKKGKLYIQKNTSATRDRQRRVDRSTELKPVWPTLRDCTSPVTDVMEQLTVTGHCRETLTVSLDSRNITTVGDLCSLTESEVEELPIKAPRVIVFKLVMQAYEDRMKNLQSYKVRQQKLQQETCTGDASLDLKTHLSALNPDAVMNLLKESLSETDMKVVATNFHKNMLPSSSKSIGIVTELEMQDKASSTDEDIFQHLVYILPEALKKKVEQNEQKTLVNQVLQILFHHCSVPHILEGVREVVSDSNFEPPNGSDRVNVNAVNQCFKLLQFLCTESALPLDSARELYQDNIRQFGVQSVLSEILKCGESENESPIFLKDIMNCIKIQLCTKKETAANVFQCLVTDNTLPFALQHFTAKQLVPHIVNQCGDQTVLDTVLTDTTMTKEKALESFKKHFSSDDVDEKNWMNTIFKLMCLSGITNNKRNKILSMLNNIIELVECE